MILASVLGVLTLAASPEAEARCVRSVAAFPTEKLRRPLTQPAGTGSVSAAGIVMSAFAGGGAASLADFSVGYAVAPACGVELAVETRHALTPASPFEHVGASLTVGLTPWLALAFGNESRVAGAVSGVRTVGTWVGAPLRLPLNRWLGLVGLDRVTGLDVLWSSFGGFRLDAWVALPAGVLLQPHSRVAVQVLGRPSLRVIPRLTATVDAELEVLFVALRWLDLRALAVVSPRESSTRIDATLGVTARF